MAVPKTISSASLQQSSSLFWVKTAHPSLCYC
jgi:hypothetical protein